jgi:UrcA family protein
MSRSVALILAALFAAGAAAPAFAQRSDEHRLTVYSEGLDLHTSAGSAEMLARIEDAAAHVCDPNRGPMLTSERETWRECTDESTLNAVLRLHNPNVTAQYEGRFPEVVIEGADDSAN